MAWWIWLLIGIGTLIVLLFVYSFLKLKFMGNTKSSDLIVNLNDSNFKTHIRSGVVIVDFWAEWCAPCRMMVPVLNQIAEEEQGKVKVCKLNVDKARKMAAKFSTKSIPTLLIFRNGKEVKRLVGVKPKSTIMTEIRKIQI